MCIRHLRIMSKIDGYLGFAVKSGKILYGIDNIEVSKKRKYLLVLCPTAGSNLVKNAKFYSEKYEIPLVTVDSPLENIIYKTNCKIIALLDANMAKAVKENAGR